MGLVLLISECLCLPISEQKEYCPSVEKSSTHSISLMVMMRVGRWKQEEGE